MRREKERERERETDAKGCRGDAKDAGGVSAQRIYDAPCVLKSTRIERNKRAKYFTRTNTDSKDRRERLTSRA